MKIKLQVYFVNLEDEMYSRRNIYLLISVTIQMGTQKWLTPLQGFWVYVDSFFIISGTLTSYYAAEKLLAGKRLNVIKMYIRRYYK